MNRKSYFAIESYKQVNYVLMSYIVLPQSASNTYRVFKSIGVFVFSPCIALIYRKRNAYALPKKENIDHPDRKAHGSTA